MDIPINTIKFTRLVLTKTKEIAQQMKDRDEQIIDSIRVSQAVGKEDNGNK